MAFQTPIAVKDAITAIQRREYVLPAIQREFVWSPVQIVQLFDSLLTEYPIGSLLFWKVGQDIIQEFQFYEFLRNYHERDNRRNPRAELILLC